MQPAVDLTSAPDESPRKRLTPSAIEPSMSARCEIDLSPGTAISPSSRRALLTVAITGNPPLPPGERVGEWGVNWQHPWTSARAPSGLPRKARPGEGRRPREGGANGRASG